MLARSRTNHASAWLVAGLVALPLDGAFAVDPRQASQPAPKGQPSAGVHTAVLRGRVTNEAGTPLAGVRVRVAIPATDMRFVDAGAERGFVKSPRDHKLHKLLEVRSDAGGDYRLEIPGIAARTLVSIDAIKPGYRRLGRTFMSGGDPREVEVSPGKAAEASLILKPGLHLISGGRGHTGAGRCRDLAAAYSRRPFLPSPFWPSVPIRDASRGLRVCSEGPLAPSGLLDETLIGESRGPISEIS